MNINLKADFAYQQKLMRICFDRAISIEKINEIVTTVALVGNTISKCSIIGT